MLFNVASCTARHITFGLFVIGIRWFFSQKRLSKITAAIEVWSLFGFSQRFIQKTLADHRTIDILLNVLGAEIFSPDKAQIERARARSKTTQPPRERAATQAGGKRSSQKRLFGVIWSSE